MALLKSDKNDAKTQRAEEVARAAGEAQMPTGKKSRSAESYWNVSWRIFKKNRLGLVCLGVVVTLVFVAIFAGLLAPYDPDAIDLPNRLLGPGGAHLLGTDELGRDIFSRIIFGCRISLSVGVVSQAIALFIGFFAGVLAGYFGGRTDAVISFG